MTALWGFWTPRPLRIVGVVLALAHAWLVAGKTFGFLFLLGIRFVPSTLFGIDYSWRNFLTARLIDITVLIICGQRRHVSYGLEAKAVSLFQMRVAAPSQLASIVGCQLIALWPCEVVRIQQRAYSDVETHHFWFKNATKASLNSASNHSTMLVVQNKMKADESDVSF